MMGAGQCAARRLSGGAVFLLVFLPFAVGHFLSCLLRGVNAVLTPELLAALPLTPAQLGMLTSAFFGAFALAQLPIGMALDRYGPRNVQLPLMLLAAVGVWLFGHGHSFAELLCARAIMGLGLGGCFMSAVKAISASIAPAKLPSVHGYLIAVGGVGAASATLPVKMALLLMDWRAIFALLAGALVVCALLIFLLAPATCAPAKAAATTRLRDVYRDRAFRDTVALMLVPHSVFFGVQGLWIGKWLGDVAGFSGDAIAYLLYLSMAAIIFGAIGIGMLTEWLGRRAIAPIDVAAAGIVVFIGVQLAFVVNHAPIYQLLAVLFTLVGTVTGLEYAIVAQSMPPALIGRAATCLNLLIFSGAFLVQAGFGLVLGIWHANVHQHYPAAAYQAVFGVLVLLQLPGLIGFLIRRRRGIVASGKMVGITSQSAGKI